MSAAEARARISSSAKVPSLPLPPATAQRRKRHAQRIRRVPHERMPRVTGEKGRAVEAVNIVFDSTMVVSCEDGVVSFKNKFFHDKPII